MTNKKIVSWNINGLRSIMKKGTLKSLVETERPDILCLQEIRCNDDVANELLRSSFGDVYDHIYINTCKTKKGYSGTAMLCQHPPLKVTFDLPTETENKEGRVITAFYDNMVLVNVYTPNSGQKTLTRLEYRTRRWDVAFGAYMEGLTVEFDRKNVIVCGDLNVAHRDLDIHNPRGNAKNAGFTIEERQSFEQNVLRQGKFVDAFRHLYPERRVYSWWSALGRARVNNKGWRIDYFIVSNNMIARNMIRDCDIYDDMTGSDHAPCVLVCTY